MSEIKNIAEAEAFLENAAKSYQAACQNEDLARREVTACLNELNKAQKRFDEFLEMRKGQLGHKGSDWWRKKHEKPIPAYDNEVSQQEQRE